MDALHHIGCSMANEIGNPEGRGLQIPLALSVRSEPPSNLRSRSQVDEG